MSYVYIMTNESMPGLLKVGKAKNPEHRVAVLSGSTSAAMPFKIEKTIYVGDRAFEVEQAAHRILSKYRFNPNREFFKVSPKVALDAIYKALLEDDKTHDSAKLKAASLAKARSHIAGKQSSPVEQKLPAAYYEKVAKQAVQKAKKASADLKKFETIAFEAPRKNRDITEHQILINGLAVILGLLGMYLVFGGTSGIGGVISLILALVARYVADSLSGQRVNINKAERDVHKAKLKEIEVKGAAQLARIEADNRASNGKIDSMAH